NSYSPYLVFSENREPILLSDIESCGKCLLKKTENFDDEFKKASLEYIDEEVVYLGTKSWGHGHYIISFFNRLYFMLNEKYKNKKVVFNCCSSFKGSEEYFDLINVFGIPNEQIIKVKEGCALQFKKVIIPEPTNCHIRQPHFTHQYFSKCFHRITENIQSDYHYDKIYLTRIRQKENGVVAGKHLFGEKKIENIFRKNGFEIICPDEHSVLEQVKMYKNCKTLASISGSAGHNNVFMRDGTNNIVIARNSWLRIQAKIDEIKNINSVFILNAGIAENINGMKDDGACFMYINENFKQFLDDNNFVYTLDDLTLSLDEYVEFYGCYTKHNNNLLQF
ncbi:MAG: glycosyltransferase family 61 protein, partial [Rickettsiales bacterium]|nr:glycosyltransferase family 61 protein [Rickettsiales bacterium]